MHLRYFNSRPIIGKLLIISSFITLLVSSLLAISAITDSKAVAAPASFTVTNTNDTGAGSLRQAITDANSNGNPGDQDVINFNIAGAGDKTIQPQTSLNITQSVLINGYTQGDATPNTQPWPEAMDGTLRVSIDNSQSGGIVVEGDNVELRGLNISKSAVSDVIINGVDNFILSGCYIGTDITGSLSSSTVVAGAQLSIKGSHGSRVGGSNPAERNVLAFGQSGIIVAEKLNTKQTQNLTIQGNNISVGSDSLTMDFSTQLSGSGIVLKDDTSDVTIGGVTATEGNTIINWNSLLPIIQTLGTVHNVFISKNAMSYSGSSGIAVAGNASKVAISQNAIHDNTGIGVDLGSNGVTANDAYDIDTGPNDLLNAPGYTNITETGGNTEITFTADLPAGNYRIEFFRNAVANPNQGEVYVGYTNIVSAGTGLQEFSHTISGTGHDHLTLTATEIDPSTPSGFGATSEFGSNGQNLESDLSLRSVLLNPQDFADGNTLNYSMTIRNNGPASIDISQLNSQNPAGNFLTQSFLPPQLTFAGTTGDVGCTYLGDGSAVFYGPLLANHSNYGIAVCSYTGGSPHILEAGDSFSYTLHATVTDDSNPIFTNYSSVNAGTFDNDYIAILNIRNGGGDIIDGMLAYPINNFSASSQSPKDVRANKTLLNPQDMVNGQTVQYKLDYINDGPSPIDPTVFDLGGINPLYTSLFIDYLPPNLTYVSQSNPDINCVDAGTLASLGAGTVFADHPDYHAILCGYYGSDTSIGAGESITTDITVLVNDASQDFDNIVSTGATIDDPDYILSHAIAYRSQALITNSLAQQLNNMAAGHYSTANDYDGDGASDKDEDTLAPNGDGNNDGIADKLQAGVVTVQNSLTGEYTTLAVSGDCDEVTSFAILPEAGQSILDPQYEYPLGLADFTLSCDTLGGSANVTLYYDKVYDQQTYQLRKLLGSNYDNLSDGSIATADIGGNTVTTVSYTIQDGGVLDNDNNTNSSITDPVGMGVEASMGSAIDDAISNMGNRLSDTGDSIWFWAGLALSIIVVTTKMISHSMGRKNE